MVIPKLPDSKLCPVTALSNMLHLVPGSNNDPLFAIFKANKWSPLTDSTVRKHLKRVLLLLQLQHHNFTFHNFRRSGATWAFEHGVPIEVIKQQGTWSSDCVWRYIQKSNSSTSPLTQAFQLHLLPSWVVWVRFCPLFGNNPLLGVSTDSNSSSYINTFMVICWGGLLLRNMCGTSLLTFYEFYFIIL